MLGYAAQLMAGEPRRSGPSGGGDPAAEGEPLALELASFVDSVARVRQPK